MRKIAKWIAAISITVFIFAWSIGGLMIFNNDFENDAWVYVGLVSIVIFFCSLIYLKTTVRCPHCGKPIQVNGKFCPHCGEEIK